MPPHRMPPGGPMKARDPKKTLLRILAYMKKYWVSLVVVVACIFANAFSSIVASTSLGRIVDEYILPMVASGSTDFGPLVKYLLKNQQKKKLLKMNLMKVKKLKKEKHLYSIKL